jgi:hypothetical protein
VLGVDRPSRTKTFPKQPKEQLVTICDLLCTNGSEWSSEQIIAQFKGGGRYKGAIAENLERLQWFGVILNRIDETGKSCWQFTDSSSQSA